MKRVVMASALIVTLIGAAACSNSSAKSNAPEIETASEGSLKEKDRQAASARRKPERRPVSGETAPHRSNSAADLMDREITIPAGTILPVALESTVSSDSSELDDPVRGTLREPVRIDGVGALPAGTAVIGHVTAAERSARVKGRAFVTFRFTAIDRPGDAARLTVRTEPVTSLAAASRKADAAKIGGGAAGGALIGGILGGGDGAAKGAVIGGAAGTGLVLSTRGKEVRLEPGTSVSVRLAAPVTLRVVAPRERP